MPTTTGKKIAIVTGSALGLGYELASQLIANGWQRQMCIRDRWKPSRPAASRT